MHIFKDDSDQEWTLSIHVASIKRVRALLPGIDLARIDEADPSQSQGHYLAARLTLDPLLLCDVIFCLVKPQAEERRISDERFGELMGRSLRGAFAAFWEEINDFFQSLDRSDLARLAATQRELLAEIVEHNAGTIDEWEQKRKGDKEPKPDQQTERPSTDGS